MKDFDFDFEVTLDSETRKKWNEMCNDPYSFKLMMTFYQELVQETKRNANNCIDLYHRSYKEKRLREHFESIEKLEKHLNEHLKV
tara:strand:- start:140 stop:394 length:255 start_codon:yes stop_codon:yes gene_type:complete